MAGKRTNGEGSLFYEASRDRWVGMVTVGFTDTGRQIRRKVTAPTKREALARLRELTAATEVGTAPARKDFTVARWLDEWAETLDGTVAPATAANYRNVLRLYVLPHLGRKKLTTLQPRDVTAMLRELERAGLSANSQRLARSVLRRALRRAEVEGLVARNVAALADGVRVGAQEGRTLTPEQARSVLAETSEHRLGAAFTVALALGLRRGELLGLAWPDVDLDGRPPRLTVRRALKRLPGGLVLDEPKTKGSRRTVHLPAQVVDVLRRHRRRQVEERLAAGDLWTELPLGADLVFRTPFGTAVDPDNFRNMTYAVTERAGIGRWSPHELRHSAASILLAQGVPLEVVSETLGHSSIRITADVYGHLLDGQRAKAAEAMGAALWGAEA